MKFTEFHMIWIRITSTVQYWTRPDRNRTGNGPDRKQNWTGIERESDRTGLYSRPYSRLYSRLYSRNSIL